MIKEEIKSTKLHENIGNAIKTDNTISSDLPFRKGVGMMIINKQNKIFVGKRIDKRQKGWQMPQGDVDLDELLEDAVIREMEE
ncbi:MAG TPA: NUDIX domain-containing protein, partial [Candidatus Megaira endosymbiont of Hartmannula sinica]|nr:NUDIX domain-containing protein [Candidatus Megaera endosymbiont of Hartmannula sinica]